jgi:ABC-type phosphate transport system substrate-binding protein
MALLARAALLAALAGLVPAAVRSAPPGDDAPAAATVVVVANPDVPAAAVDREEARRIWMLRRRFWRDGTRIVPVNLPASSPVRDAFSRAVLGRPARDLAAYWNDLWFHGTAPPPVVPSERAVLLFVARTRGAVGYVSQAAYVSAAADADDPPSTVRVLLTVEAR